MAMGVCQGIVPTVKGREDRYELYLKLKHFHAHLVMAYVLPHAIVVVIMVIIDVLTVLWVRVNALHVMELVSYIYMLIFTSAMLVTKLDMLLAAHAMVTERLLVALVTAEAI
jgi:hypothetical protein